MPTGMTRAAVAAMIDHTLLKPEVTPEDVRALIAEAQELGAYAVCISPSMLPVTAHGLVVATVAGFPSGKHHSLIKAAEARLAVDNGAREVDMVIDVGAARVNDFNAVLADVLTVAEAIEGQALLKVIIESAALTDEQIVGTCEAAVHAGAAFVKTSTGFHPAGGASAHAVALMKTTVAGRAKVKASGGIRTAQTALEMIEAGADRLGVSSTRAILDGLPH